MAIDIAKDTLQIQSPQRAFQIRYDTAGLEQLWECLKTLSRPFVICEATGGYEQRLLRELFAREVPLHLVSPARVRAFAKSEGIKAKTDPIDAKVLRRYAQEKRPRPTPPPEPIADELAALLDRRAQLSEQLAREKNRLQKCPGVVAASIRQMIAYIEKQLAALDAQIERLFEHDEQLRDRSERLQSVTGIGKMTAWTLLAYLPELPDIKRNQAVALAGLAPFNRDTGKHSGRRSIQGGRAKVRRCLYMAAQSAARHNPVIQPYVARLLERNKPYECAMVAAMRKLLIHLQSLLQNPQ